MTLVLEELKGRLEAAQKRLATAQQRFQAAQVELQAAQGDCNVWGAAVLIETREDAARAAAANENQLPMPLSVQHPQPQQKSPIVPISASGSYLELQPECPTSPDTTNKTDLVRDLLRQHASGMTPADLWESAKGQISSRAYLYAILKRLRDRDEVTQRRKKYVLKFKPLEAKSESDPLTVQ